MSPLAQLEAYLEALRSRLRRLHAARALALLAAILLVLTLVPALLPPQWTYAQPVTLGLRIALGLGFIAAGLLLWRWLRELKRDEGASALEAVLPEQSGRVDTFLQERRRAEAGAGSPLLELLAEDAQRIADDRPVEQALPARRWALPAGAGVIALGALAALLVWGTGRWGDGARALWTGQVPQNLRVAVAAGGIAVEPGDVSIRRNQDLPVSAQVAGYSGAVQLHVKFGAEGNWEAAPMEADGKGGYRFTLYAVREAAQYYVSAGRLKSSEHKVAVVDLPRIESLRLAYDYPGWTGMKRRVEESGGDIRAVEGTRVSLEVVTDTPMTAPLLVVNGEEDDLAQSGTTANGRLTVAKPGHYRIATRFGDEVVALTEDFAIEVVPDEKPNVEIARPGRDYHATNIEEVPVTVTAQDDFRLESLELRYSVNGGEWRSEKLDANAADIRSAALLRLEEMQEKGKDGSGPLLVPGDLVSYYAVARDHRASVQTDLFLIQVQPFDRRYSQSQAAGGGGGGGGDDEGAISQRQREVLLATWNLQRAEKTRDQRENERRADSARMLSEVQKTLEEQASTLVGRARARLLTGADENIRKFVESLEEAAKEMAPAAEKLQSQSLEDAVVHEQRALQHLLRAEATFREIQVAQQGNPRGGGGGQQAGRDVAEMTELELDLEKNQYETEPQMTAQQQGEAESEALRRLRELARRQEQLAREAQRNAAAPEAQRWQQEQLRREAEELRRQLEQLAQQRNGSQSQQGQQGRSGQQGQQGQQGQANSRGQPGSPGSSQGSAAAEAAQQVAEAMRQMQGGGDQARQASERLNRAREELERGQRQAVGERFEEMARSARDLADRQRETEEELRAAVSGPRAPASIANPRARVESGLGYEQAERLAQEKRDIQQELEALQRQMQSTRAQSRERAPKASERVGEASAALDEQGTAGRLARSALEIERGRGLQAAARDGLISDSLQELQRGLDEAATLAAGEGKGQQEAPKAEASDLLAELGALRRQLEQARAQAQAQQGGQPGGQPGAEAGGQVGSGEQAAGNPQAGGLNGGNLNRGALRGGNVAGGGDDLFRGPAFVGTPRISGERLARLRQQLPQGDLSPADVAALRELSERLRRTDDPLASEYQRMVALVNQLELAALRAEQANADAKGARAPEQIDDPGRYRDNVAEYYRRLGGAHD